MKCLGLACAVLLSSWNAHAEVVILEYQGTVGFIREYNGAGEANEVSSSSLLPAGVQIGDRFHGRFIYDTATPINPRLSDAGSAFYAPLWWTGASPNASSIVFDKSGTSFAGGHDGSVIHVTNGIAPSSLDILKITGGFSWSPADKLQGQFEMRFFDDTGRALSGVAIPNQLDLGAWSYSDVFFTWYDQASDSELRLGGPLSSVTKVSPVPEPETYAMLLAGLAILCAGAARNRIRPLLD